MKTLVTCIVGFFSMVPIFAQTPDMEKLKSSISQEFKKATGDFALAAKNLHTNEIILINENEVFHAASTMKTPVMMEVFRQAQAGKFKMSDSIIVKNEFKSIVDNSLYSLNISDDSADDIYSQIGKKSSIYDLTYQMIIVSSNLATNLLIDLVGAKNVQKNLVNLGLQEIKILRGVEDSKAFQKGLNNVVTAHDLCIIYEKIANKQFISPDICDAMIDVLLDQKFNEVIPALLPKSTKIAHKTGSIVGVQHDSGIVYLPDGTQYVVVLLSKNVKNANEGIAVQAQVSKMIYDYFTK